MPFIVLSVQLEHEHEVGVRKFALSAPKTVKDRIIHVAGHDAEVPTLLQLSHERHYQCYNQAGESQIIPLHNLLNWVESSGFNLGHVVSINRGSFHDQYIFQENKKHHREHHRSHS
jgi:hypothetical protein